MDGSLYSDMINFARANNRRIHMAARHARVGVPICMHPAANCRDVPEDGSCALEGPRYYMRPPAAVCSKGHMHISDKFLATNKSHDLILEDEVHMSDDFSVWINNTRRWPENADMIRLERWRTLRLLVNKISITHLRHRIARVYDSHVGPVGHIITCHGTPTPLRQKLRRGYSELASSASRWITVLTGEEKPDFSTYAHECRTAPSTAHELFREKVIKR